MDGRQSREEAPVNCLNIFPPVIDQLALFHALLIIVVSGGVVLQVQPHRIMATELEWRRRLLEEVGSSGWHIQLWISSSLGGLKVAILERIFRLGGSITLLSLPEKYTFGGHQLAGPMPYPVVRFPAHSRYSGLLLGDSSPTAMGHFFQLKEILTERLLWLHKLFVLMTLLVIDWSGRRLSPRTSINVLNLVMAKRSVSLAFLMWRWIFQLEGAQRQKSYKMMVLWFTVLCPVCLCGRLGVGEEDNKRLYKERGEGTEIWK